MAVLFNPITVELPMDIGIPEEYIPEQKTRIKLYRRIASIHEEEKLIGLKDEFQERFGPLPEIVQNLFFQILVKIKAEKIGLSAVVKEGNSIVLRFSSFANEMERGPLPEVGGGIRPGKNAYWLTLMNFQSDEWRNDLLVAMDLVEDRLAQQRIRSKDFGEQAEKSGVMSFLGIEKSP
jgi:transcription-repair coupling factor (superfamily II helicase)